VTSEYIRVPGTTMLLACVLDRIMREHLEFAPIKHPGWTFQHVGNYQVPDGPVYKHECEVYLGGARAEGPTHVGLETCMEIRVHALKNNWTALPSHGSELWTFTVWAKTPGRDIGPKVYVYHERDNTLFLSDLKPAEAPRKIELWWKQPLTAKPHDPDLETDEDRLLAQTT
jgi:hypothetical protein